MEWITVAAIVLGPILAVQVQKLIERTTEEKRERFFIFKTLMRSRGNIMSREHVDALNMIPLVFSKKNETDAQVRRKWEIYLNHLNSPYPVDGTEAVKLAFGKDNLKCLIDLLIALAKAFGYQFDEEDINRVYSPIGHNQEAQENQAIRLLSLQLLRGNLALKTQTALFPGNPQLAQRIRCPRVQSFEGRKRIESHPDLRSLSADLIVR
jgi:hypothetical protein